MDLTSGAPYWLIKDGLPFSYPTLEQNIQTDVVILGGGISGALAAYHLNRVGVPSIVIDARSIGLGSTCASTSLLQYEIDTPLHQLKDMVGNKVAVSAYRQCGEAIKALGTLCDHIGYQQFDLKSSLYYAAYKKDEAFLLKEMKARKDAGFEVNWLEPTETAQQFQINSPAILSALAADTDAYGLTHALHQAAIRNGLQVYERSPVDHIVHSRSSVTLTTSKGFVVRAKKLVYATGYEVVEFIDKKIVQLQSTYACCSSPSSTIQYPGLEDTLVWNTAEPYLYMRSTRDGRVIVGGRDEPFYDPVKRDRLLRKKSKQLTQDVNKLFPKMNFSAEFQWTGTFGSTKDGLPYIGSYDKLPNSLFALGFGGNGITFSQIAAEILCDLVTGKKNDAIGMYGFKR